MSGKTHKNIETFKIEVENTLGKDYEVLSDVYVNNTTNVKMYHKICGNEYFATPHNILGRKSKCPFCYGAIKRTNEDFLDKIKDIHGDKITLLEEYVATDTSILCQCNICSNIWKASPSNLLRGSSCPKCACKEAGLRGRKKNDVFIKEVKSLHNGIIPLEKYNGLRNKILFKCEICGEEWYKTPDEVLNKGNNCPICKMTKGERKIYCYLKDYNIRFERQKKFKDLRGIGNRYLSYDFYLPDYNLLIEYQGEFHDGTANIQNEDEYKTQKEHDKRKSEYAKKHNKKLLEIWYYDYKQICSILSKHLNNSV